MATYVIPYRVGGKTRLGDPGLALAMLSDVKDAVNEIADEALVVDAPGGQGDAVAAELAARRGPITIVNSDLPCVTPDDLQELTKRAPAIVAARDGTTNAVSILDAADFAPLYVGAWFALRSRVVMAGASDRSGHESPEPGQPAADPATALRAGAGA